MLFGNMGTKKEPEMHLLLFESHCSSISFLRSKAETQETFEHKRRLYDIFFNFFLHCEFPGCRGERNG